VRKIIIIISISIFFIRCQTQNNNIEPQPQPVYELSFNLCDDFDGNGCHQTYNGQQLATAGALSTQLWSGSGEVVQLTTSGQSKSIQVYDVVDEHGKLIKGAEYSVSIIRWIGAKNIQYWDNRFQRNIQIIRGQEYGKAEIVSSPMDDSHGYVVKLSAESQTDDVGSASISMIYPHEITVKEFQEWRAIVKLSSESSGSKLSAILDYHGVDPSGLHLSWYTQISIHKWPDGKINIKARWRNRSHDIGWSEELMIAELNRWYDLKITFTEINENEVRMDYFVDDRLLASIFPDDSTRLLNGEITEFHRNIGCDTTSGKVVAYFDNIYGVYTNRVQ